METTPIKWVKFFNTDVPEYQTYFLEGKMLQNDGETHEFGSSEQAQAESTSEVFIFWDGQPIGVGALTA